MYTTRKTGWRSEQEHANHCWYFLMKSYTFPLFVTLRSLGLLSNNAFYPVLSAKGSSLRKSVAVPLFRAFFLSWRVKHGIANQPFKWQEVQKTIKNQQNPAPTELSSFTCTSETFPYTFEGWLQYIPCRALYSKFLLLVWHRLNLLIFRACKLQLIYYASCCGGGPLGKLCVWESRFWYSASTLGLFSDFMSRLLESWIGTFSV